MSLPHIGSGSSFDTEKNVDYEKQHTIVPQKRTIREWLAAVGPLVVHCVFSVGIVLVVLVYVDGHFFSVTERSSLVHIVGGTRTTPFQLMQSDIVTILSAAIAASKWALAAWAASLCWHATLFLMERRGIEYRGFQVLLDYSLLSPTAYSKDFSTWIIGALLLSCMIANFSSPILTGSVTWISSNQLARGLSIDPVPADFIGDGTMASVKRYYSDQGRREAAATTGVGIAELAWGAGTNPKGFKRVLPAVEDLNVNSTIKTAMLPYFEVHSIHWISNSEADNIPGFKSLDKFAITAPVFDSAPIASPPRPLGCVLLIPNTTTNWSSDPMEPTVIRDTRLLLFHYRYYLDEESDQPYTIDRVTEHVPSDIYQMNDGGRYFIFAWVTFSAGVGQCKDHQCLISSPSTIQNSTPIELEPHPLTSQALAMAPIISLSLVGQNASLPSSWSNLDVYIEAVLIRSYSAAWNTLMVSMVPDFTYTSYIPSFPGLKAQVAWWRVNVWLGTQVLVTLLSVTFLIIRAKLSEYPLTGRTSLIGFYLDTTGIPMRDSLIPPEEKWMLKIKPRGDRLKVILE